MNILVVVKSLKHLEWEVFEFFAFEVVLHMAKVSPDLPSIEWEGFLLQVKEVNQAKLPAWQNQDVANV